MNRLALMIFTYFFPYVMLFFVGCERDYDRELTPTTDDVSVQIAFAPSAYGQMELSQNLDIEIEVLRFDRYGVEFSFDPPVIKKMSLGTSQPQIAKLKVPMGEGRIVEVKGYEFGELVLTGRHIIDYVGDGTVIANIRLDPVGIPLLSISSPQTSYKVGDEMLLNIRLKNVSNLFGMALELEYNRSRFFPLGVEAHPSTKFAKSSLPVFHDLNLDSRAGQIQIALTLTKGQKPITIGQEGEIIATAKFRAVKAGTSEIRVKSIKGESPKMTQPNGEPLDNLVDMRQYLLPSDNRLPRGVVRFLVK